ncbi:hypothetical protein TNCV_5033251 [Trichonephila clavipes]|nr:hypothetical protein TNCV_5033251 [Trichonephila clavipes]
MLDKELWRLGPDGPGVLCANRTREAKRDFCDLPIRRYEGRVVNTPLVFKRVIFQETRGKKDLRERERSPVLDGGKGLVRDWSGKTMNAGGFENRI